MFVVFRIQAAVAESEYQDAKGRVIIYGFSRKNIETQKEKEQAEKAPEEELPQDEPEKTGNGFRNEREVPWVRTISMEETEEFLEWSKNFALRIAVGVFLCILSPACLILLGGLADSEGLISENLAGGMGTVVLLVLVAIGALILVLAGMQSGKYDYLDKEPFCLQINVQESVEKKKEEVPG